MVSRVYLNLDLCCGCKSCAAACSYPYFDHSNLSHSAVGEKANLPMHCMQCELAACAESCPTGALKKCDDGIVRRSIFLCVGCSSCISACPVGALPVSLKYQVPAKCDLCSDRIAEGKVPRCVATCTSGALSFAEVESLAADKEKNWISARMISNAPFKRR
jgi:Fe-S-cluster-containing dehydrogenase component